MQRRSFVHALAAAGAATWWPVGRTAFAATPAAPLPGARRLVVVFLRGAVDGLSVLAPWDDPAYRAARPQLALARPGADGGVLDLDGRFGLHPALAPLLPWWQAGRLAFVHASGSPDLTRSHFDAQDDMESGTPGRRTTPDGWMNRLLGAMPPPAAATPAPPPAQGGAAALRAVALGPVLPRILSGSQAVANLPPGASTAQPALLDRPAVARAFDALYAGDDDMARAYRASREAHHEMSEAMRPPMAADGRGDAAALATEMQAADRGAPPPAGFAADAARLATLMRRDPTVQLAFAALGGWDTHAHQGAAQGQLAQRLHPLALGLAAFAQRLGPALADTTIVVMSEFGRTVHENGTGGTDHGHGNAMWVLGGDVAGGRVHGRWPGLEPAALHEGRDLAVTTDFRAVLAGLCERQLRLPDARLAQVFPGFAGPALDLSRA